MPVSTVREKLYEIWKSNPYWSRFIGSQFSDGLAEFVSQMVYRCEQFARRRLQESFLSKAINVASILAAAEDRAYVGLKISPSYGKVTITNISQARQSLPKNKALISQNAIDYILCETVDLKPGESCDVKITQLKLTTITQKVINSAKWYSVELERDLTKLAHSIDVYVNNDLWEKRFKFRNTSSTSKAYMEFYTTNQKLGVRFGNGINGAIPNVGDDIKIDVWCTVGDSTLINDQVINLFDDEHLDKCFKIVTKNTITGGASGDSIEDIRNGALYSTAYDHQLAFDGDYTHFIKTNVGGLIWLDVWGEAEEEKLHGKDKRNINKIFISAYSDRKSNDDLKLEIENLFIGREGYNEEYVYRTRVDLPFTVNIVGKVLTTSSPKDAEDTIKTLLNNKYGKDVKGKKKRIPIDDIWDDIHNIKVTSGIIEFNVIANNINTKSMAGHYNYIDIDNSIVTLTY